MSRLHLVGFLADLAEINPKFRTRTSSLRGLVSHLESTVATPREMTVEAALRHCRNPADGRIGKYRPAVERLARVWGKGAVRPYPKSYVGNLLPEIELNRICFRGDSRAPNEIFPRGFAPQSQNPFTYRSGRIRAGGLGTPASEDKLLYPIDGIARAGDLDPISGVCVTPDINVAALFPLPTADFYGKSSWIYMVHVKTGAATNTRQVLDALQGLAQLRAFEQRSARETPTLKNRSLIRKHHEDRVANILQNLYGRELAAGKISSSSVWCAFKISRSWNTITEKGHNVWDEDSKKFRKAVERSGDYKDGGTYQIVERWTNPAAEYPNARWQAAVQKFLAKTDQGTNYRMPTHLDGYQPSNIGG